MRAHLVAVMMALSACVRPAAPPTAGSAGASAGSTADFLTAEDASGICFLRLEAVVTQPGSTSCISDDGVMLWQGLLAYPCGGGEAEVLFGNERLAGAVSGDRVHAELVRRFQYTDGCLWESKQVIEGSLAGGKLRYQYDETAAPGQHDCDEACAVVRELRVTR